jgi:hypothetical protein
MQKMTSFCIYMDWEEQLTDLTNEERGIILSAMFEYKRTGVVPELPRLLSLVFSFIRQQFDRDADKYEQKIEKRREAGKKGGRPAKETSEKNEQTKAKKAKKANGFSEKQTKAKKADTVTDTDTDTDTVTDTDTDIDNYKDTDVSFPQTDVSHLPALPLIDGTKYVLTVSEVDRYKELYPGIDVDNQIRCMVGWLESNPKNRKTRNGIKRFINGWLTKEQNRAPRISSKDTRGVISDRAKKAGFDINLEDLCEKPTANHAVM